MDFPKKNERLFKAEIKSDTGAWLQNPASKFFTYSEGYKNAGDALYEHCIKNPFYNNTVVYPLIFTYRQFIELRLKELILMANKLNDIDEDFPDEHNILTLWKKFRELYNKVGEETKKEYFDNAENVIAQFTNEDPKSMNFRYPVGRGKIRRNSLKRETVDIENVKNVIDRLYNFLTALWDELSHLEDMKQEVIRDYFSEYWY